MAFFPSRWFRTHKTGLTLFAVVLLFLVCGSYAGSEWYNSKLSDINNGIHRVPGLGWLNLPKYETFFLQDTFRLGLDLKSGTHLVYQADVSRVPVADRASAVDGVRDVIERRVNAFGVSEPIVQTVKVGDEYRVIVELAGVLDPQKAKQLIGETPLLEFKESNPEGAVKKELTPEQKRQLDAFNAAAKKKAEDILAKARAGEDFAALAKSSSEDTATKDAGGDLGVVTSASPYASFLAEVKGLKKSDVSPKLAQTAEGFSVLKLTDARMGQEVNASHILICYKGASRCDKDTSKEDAKKKADELKKQATATNFADLAKANSTEPNAASSGGSLGWFGKGMMTKSFEDAVFSLKKGEVSQVVETEFGYHIVYKQDERQIQEFQIARILFRTQSAEGILPPADPWKMTGLTGKQLKRAYVEFDPTTQLPEVGIEFNDEGKKLFGEITGRNVGKPVAIFLDGQPISVPTVNQAITDGRAVIQGNFDIEEAKKLTRDLNTGALPVPIVNIGEQTIGATLGAESLQKSMNAGLIGFLLVAIFMIVFYRLPGLIAVIALCMYTAFTLALFKVWPVTLSLAGIAGFILSIGMAVDANILIFERLKEELRWGRTLEGAVTNGFKRAWTSIRDSNVSSLITCVILFWFSASLIKGFALTLALGILVSMFSAIVVTRIALRFVTSSLKIQSFWLFSGKKSGDSSSVK